MIPIIYLSFAFGLSELLLLLLKHSKKSFSKKREDRGSMILLWLVITIGFFLGFFLAKHGKGFYQGFGLVMIIFGLIIRWIAIFQLGKSFTVDVVIKDAAELKTDGIYEKIRHPSYSGLLSVIVGFGLTFSSIYSFVVFVLPVFMAVIYRISVEEKVMINEFGDSYLKYKMRSKRIIPGIY
ncbi:MAG TPA: isoprenylcysteine carboxylmethyltransferase family protein [Bacteroidales bacterium]|nr:isoprenylcysteine carboxylmethyltransferase family protein [Bacteroidales bacterium]